METNLIKEKGNYKLFQDIETEKFYIACKTENPERIIIEKRFFNVYLNGSNDIENDSKYEVLEFREKSSNDFATSLFNFMITLNKSIKDSVEEIESFLSSKNSIDLMVARGFFAEIIAYNEKRLEIVHNNAIYDFRKDGIDIEIKSVSKNQSSIQISSQQATNNPNAKVICMEVIETSTGMSVKELLLKYNVNHERYNWLKAAKSNFLDIKFEISRETSFTTGDVFKNLRLPKEVLFAKFIVKVEF